MSRGFFGDLFDFDRDGELDSFEKEMDFIAFEEFEEISKDISEIKVIVAEHDKIIQRIS